MSQEIENKEDYSDAPSMAEIKEKMQEYLTSPSPVMKAIVDPDGFTMGFTDAKGNQLQLSCIEGDAMLVVKTGGSIARFHLDSQTVVDQLCRHFMDWSDAWKKELFVVPLTDFDKILAALKFEEGYIRAAIQHSEDRISEIKKLIENQGLEAEELTEMIKRYEEVDKQINEN